MRINKEPSRFLSRDYSPRAPYPPIMPPMPMPHVLANSLLAPTAHFATLCTGRAAQPQRPAPAPSYILRFCLLARSCKVCSLLARTSLWLPPLQDTDHGGVDKLGVKKENYEGVDASIIFATLGELRTPPSIIFATLISACCGQPTSVARFSFS